MLLYRHCLVEAPILGSLICTTSVPPLLSTQALHPPETGLVPASAMAWAASACVVRPARQGCTHTFPFAVHAAVQEY